MDIVRWLIHAAFASFFSGTRGNILDNGYTRDPISVNPSSHANKHQKDEGEIGWIDDSSGDLKVSKICTILQYS